MKNVTAARTQSPAVRRRIAVGQEIATIRQDLGINTGALAEMLGVEESRLVAWETAELDLTLEEALSIEEALDEPRGTLGAAGRYVGHAVEPAMTETLVASHQFSIPAEALEAITAAATLGLGVRVRNEMVFVDEDDDGVITHEERWHVDLFVHPPANDDTLD